MALIVLSDVVVLLFGWQRLSRIGPAAALTGLFLPTPGAQLGLFALLIGTLTLLLGRERLDTALAAQAGRSLAPLATATALLMHSSPGDWLFPLQVYLILAFLVTPRRGPFREDFLLILASPGIALSWSLLLQEENPLVALTLAPVTIALACAREDTFSVITGLYRKLGAKQERIRKVEEAWRQAEGEKSRMAGLLVAASRMAVLQDIDQMKRSFERSLDDVLPGSQLRWEAELPSDGPEAKAIEQARQTGRPVSLEHKHQIALPSQRSGVGPLLTLADKDEEALRVALVLARILATCVENASLHGQVVLALEQTKNSQRQMLAQGRLAAVGRLAAGVAHELNTPLGAIRLSTEHAEVMAARKPDKLPEIFQRILGAVSKAQQTVDRLASYTAPQREAGTPEVFSAVEPVRDALNAVKVKVRDAGIELRVDCEDDILLLGQPVDLYGICSNMVLNAADALGETEGAKWISVSLKANGPRVMLTVEDNGPGITPEMVDSIFDAFVTTKKLGAGTGLGLYLSRQMAGRLGGELRYAPVGPGAKFVLDLPAQESVDMR